jgi:DNA-binding MarR family transcriptional regulator
MKSNAIRRSRVLPANAPYFERIRELFQLVTQRSAGTTLAILNESRLTLPQLVTLQQLRHAGPLSVTAIAVRLHLSMPATSHLVERLVRAGFATRREHDTDRRQRHVRIAPAGERLLDRFSRSREEEFTAAFSRLPARLRHDLLDVLSEVVDRLKEEPT